MLPARGVVVTLLDGPSLSGTRAELLAASRSVGPFTRALTLLSPSVRYRSSPEPIHLRYRRADRSTAPFPSLGVTRSHQPP